MALLNKGQLLSFKEQLPLGNALFLGVEEGDAVDGAVHGRGRVEVVVRAVQVAGLGGPNSKIVIVHFTSGTVTGV